MSVSSHRWERNRISSLELAGIVVALILATGSVTLPTFTGLVARHDGWIASLSGAIMGTLVLAAVVALDRRFPGDTLPEYSEKVLGPWLARFLLALYTVYFFHIAALVVRQSTDFLAAGFYPTAPPLSLGAPLVALTAYMVWHGLEIIGRTTLIVIPMQLVASLIVTGAAVSQLQPDLIMPLFERGVAPVFRAALIPAAWFGEVIALAFFFASVRGRRARVKGAVWGTVIVVALVVILGLSSTMLFGDQVGLLAYPHSSVARFVTIGGFLRIDPMTMAVWLFLTVVKAAVLHYVGVIALTRLLGLQDYRPLVVATAGLILVFSEGLFADKQDVDAWLLSGWPVYAFGMQLAIPALLLAAALVRFGRRGRRGPGKE